MEYQLEMLPKKWQKLAFIAADEIGDAIESGEMDWDYLNSATCEYACAWLPGPREDGEFRPIRIATGRYVDGGNLIYDWQTAVELLVEEQFEDAD